MDPVNNEVKSENVKTEENVNTEQYFRDEEDVQKTIEIVYFAKQENQIKQDRHEETEKNFIRSLKKLNTS